MLSPRRVLFALLLGALVAAHPRPANADGDGSAQAAPTLPRPTDPRALDHFRAGNDWIARARAAAEPDAQRKAYEEAVREYLKAAETERDAPFSLFWNLGHAHMQLGQWSKAEWYYRRFLELAPDTFADHRTAARDAIARLRANIERDEDDRAAPPAVAVPATAQPLPPPPPRWYDDKAGWALAGSGALIALGGGGLVWSGAILHGKADDTPRASEARDYIDRGDQRARLGGVVIGVGVAVIAAGAVRLALVPQPVREHRAASIAVGPGGLVVFGAF